MYVVDAHVHLHPCFPPERFLDAAADNMSAAGAAAGLPAPAAGVLLFTQSHGTDALGGLTPGAVGNWAISEIAETASLRAKRNGSLPLVLIGGRQIATAEGLEVLALGAIGPFPDGESIETAIKAVLHAGGMPVIPWGFGKWLGRRGEIVRHLAADRARFPLLFLGDNAGRPGAARPRLFAAADTMRRAILPGTDPLPFPEEAGKAGRLGFLVDAELDANRPFAGLKEWLSRCETSPTGYGAYERPGTFLRRQVAMQLRKAVGAR